ncbi:TnsD family Tn7-like transposition protein [Paraburkholderia bannensis]|uniref:TnsD family Tn7-like transposition protein n=1 Tax=Paraburkholderia bannensis TaxID=765414 RepID=UPI002AB6E904|nr:TnsD family Tn7-like transposition protein [Paraburkholderia bannensis]
MATDLFPPEADEPLFGVVSRYATELRVQNWPRYLANLFGHRAHFSPALAYNLSCVAENTALTWGISPVQIAEQHTLFPFYAAFLTQVQSQTMLDLLLVRRSRALATFMPKLIHQRRVVRICDACIAEDRRGEVPLHFRRVHQLPGVVVCPIHGSGLRSLGYCSSSQTPWLSVQDVMAKGLTIPLTATQEQMSHLRQVARAAQYLLESSVTVDDAFLRQSCWDALHNGGFAHGREALSGGRVVDAFMAFYGKSYLEMADLCPLTRQNWVVARLAGRQRACCALPNVLLAVFCGSFVRDESVDGWPCCPNPLAAHGSGHPVEAREARNGRYYAHCRCGHSFAYRSVAGGEPLGVEVTVYGCAYAERAKSLSGAGRSVAQIARTLQISETTARRMVRHRRGDVLPNRSVSVAQLRARWRKLVKHFGTVRRAAVAEPGLWKTIRRYSPEDLKGHARPLLARRKKR